MKQELQDLLDRIYELEGLVHLTLAREEDYDDLVKLIVRKGNEVAKFCNDLLPAVENEENSREDSVPASNQDFDMPEYSLEEEEEPENEDEEEEPQDEAPEITEESEEEITLDPVTKKGKLVFSINERFRFRRELFADSDVDFNTTLALVASMDNYEEAEDYFLNEVGFEGADPIVMEFMDVIKRYFK